MVRDPDPRTTERSPATPDTGLPPADDPGGAHAKGYSADPDPAAPEVTDPVPLVDAPPGGIRVPERDDRVRPTGRSEPPKNPDNRVVSPE